MRYAVAILFLLGCQTTQEGSFTLPFASSVAVPDTEMAKALSPLKFSGTILILTGAALLFITQGRRGWIPIVTGVALTILMAFLATVLSSQTFVYTTIAVLCLTAGIAAVNLKEFRTWSKFLTSLPSRPGTSSPSPSERGLDDRS